MTDPALLALERARQSAPQSTDRHLAVAATVAAVADTAVVIVGGAAVNVHTGEYRPTDIDLVGDLGARGTTRLDALGFSRRGRHWEIEFDDGEIVTVEFVASVLFDLATDEPVRYEVEGIVIRVIALDDLMVDRLLQVTGGETRTFEEAVSLAIAAYSRIGWPAIERRVEAAVKAGGFAEERLPDALRRVRSQAIREIRDARPKA